MNYLINTLLGLGFFTFSFVINAQSLSTKILYSSAQCVYTEPKTSQINQDELTTIFNHANKFVIPALITPKIDNQNSMLIVLALGDKPTLGYDIRFNNPSPIITLENNILYLPVTLSNPKTDRLYAQIINSPCVVFEVEKVEFKKIKLTP